MRKFRRKFRASNSFNENELNFLARLLHRAELVQVVGRYETKLSEKIHIKIHKMKERIDVQKDRC